MFCNENFVWLANNSPVLPSALHLGAGFGLTITKQEDRVPYALHKQYKAFTFLQYSGACPLTTGSELLSANGWSNPLSFAGSPELEKCLAGSSPSHSLC